MKQFHLVVSLGLLLCAPVFAQDEAATATQEPFLRIAMSREPTTLDPYLHDESSASSLLSNIYDPLIDFDGDLQLIPALAESWKEKGKTLELTLRKNIVFHDGSTFDADDVVFSIERAMNHPQSKTKGRLIGVLEVKKLNSRKVALVSEALNPVLIRHLTNLPIVPSGAPDEIKQPIGTAPYRMANYVPGKRAELEAFEDYRDGPPPVRRATFFFVGSSAERATGLIRGEFDLVQDVDVADINLLIMAPDLRIMARTGLRVAYLNLLVTQPPFNDIRVRRAVGLAIDREQLVRVLLKGEGEPSLQMAAPGTFGFDSNLQVPNADPEAAKALLAQAGYPDGIDVVLSLREGQQADLLVDQLASAGIRAEVKREQWSSLYPRLGRLEVPMYLGGWANDSGDASTFLQGKAHTADPERGFGASNSMGYSNPLLDELIEAAPGAEETRRAEMIQQAMATIVADHAVIPLYAAKSLYGSSMKINWPPRIDGALRAAEISWAE